MTLQESLKLTGCQEIDKNFDSLKDISQKIWNKPELCFEEKYAHELLTSYFEEKGFQVSRKTPLETSFIAQYGDEKGIKIGIMCEYDALPGIGHACGHNLIAEAGVAAAIGLQTALASNSDIKGQIIVYGTPAEEGGGGKILMIKHGCYDDVDLCMMVHPTVMDIIEADILAVEELVISYTGKASHAAAAPWEGINALDAAVQCYTNVSMMRQQMKPSCRVHGIISDGGLKPNIIPQNAQLQYFVRAPDNEGREALKQKVISCAEGAATATGCSVKFESRMSYSNMRSNTVLAKLYQSNAENLGIQFPDISKMPELKDFKAGSTDMGDVSHVKPSIHPFYKIESKGMNHTVDFTKGTGNDSAQAPTIIAGKAMMMSAIDVLCEPKILDEINTEFSKK